MDITRLSNEELLAMYQQAMQRYREAHGGLRQMPVGAQERIANDPLSTGARQFASDMPVAEQIAAGAGKRMTDYALGARQLAAIGPQADVLRREAAQKRAIDAPLMRTGGGMGGAVLSDIAALAPTVFIPGANTAAGATLIGAGAGAIEPSLSQTEGLQNAGVGAALGRVGKYVGDKVLGAVTPMPVDPRTQRFIEAQHQYGFVVPPADIDPNLLSRRLSGIAGKDLVQQQASMLNQPIINSIAARTAQVPAGTQLTPNLLDAQRAVQGAAYEAVAQTPTFNWDRPFLRGLMKLGKSGESVVRNRADTEIEKIVGSLDRGSFSGRELVDTVKHLRNDASANFKNANMPGGNVISEALGTAQKDAADLLEALAQRNLTMQGAQDLIPALKAARTQIAKLHTIERALQEGTGNVSAEGLRRELHRGGLTGALRDAALFSESFPFATRLPERIGSVGTNSLLEAGAEAGALTASLASGSVLPLAGAGIPLLRRPVTNLLLSPGYQKYMVNPTTSVGGRINRAISSTDAQALAEALQRILPQAGLALAASQAR